MTTAEQYLSQLDINEYQNPLEFDDFKNRAMNALYAAGNSTEFNTPQAKDAFLQKFHDSLEAWQKDEAHGVMHSFKVYERALKIRDAEKVSQTDVSDDSLFIMAVLHDLAEFLPLMNADGQAYPKSKDKNWQAKKHPDIIAMIVRKLGRQFKIEDASKLAIVLRYHDFYWTKPTRKQIAKLTQRMSEAGRIFADADRLVDETADSIDRNRKGSRGKWYLIQKSMDPKDRVFWEMRTKGLYDGLSALLTEYVNKNYWFYTQNGKEMNEKRKPEFEQKLINYYVQEYEEGWQLLGNQNQEIQLGIKGKNGKPEEVDGNGLEEIQRITSLFDQRQMIQELVSMPVAGKGSNGREYYGYSIYLPDKDTWLDPSILQFKSVDDLKSALKEAIQEFPQLLEEYMLDKEKKEEGVT